MMKVEGGRDGYEKMRGEEKDRIKRSIGAGKIDRLMTGGEVDKVVKEVKLAKRDKGEEGRSEGRNGRGRDRERGREGESKTDDTKGRDRK
ncbi:hypothetical protein, partial [Paenibacillus xylanexedens]|uniref:hypothetical protein n=1 Tax=Paenibacillus xylanexedens TaxID=528191 RepID=UPI003F7AE248